MIALAAARIRALRRAAASRRRRLAPPEPGPSIALSLPGCSSRKRARLPALLGLDCRPSTAGSRVKSACGRGRPDETACRPRPANDQADGRAACDPSDCASRTRRAALASAAKAGGDRLGHRREDLVVVAAGQHRRRARSGRPRRGARGGATRGTASASMSPPTPDASQMWAKSPTRPSETSMALVA